MSNNINALEGIACPSCQQDAEFHIVGDATFTVTDEGTTAVNDHEWNDWSPITCPQCGTTGEVRDFTTTGQTSSKPTSITALTISVDGQVRLETIPNTLEALQAAVGGYIEPISPAEDDPDGPWVAFCDEEGKVVGKRPNPVAQRILLGLGWQPMLGDTVVGPVVIVGSTDAGDQTDVPGSVVGKASKIGYPPVP